MRQAYLAILRLYPAEHRGIFATEMVETFEQAAADCRKRRFGALAFFFGRELAGLLGGLFSEWIAKFTDGNAYITARCVSEGESRLPTEVVEIQRRLQRLIGCMEFATANHEFTKARFYSHAERITREQLDRLTSKYKLNEPLAPPPDESKPNGYK